MSIWRFEKFKYVLILVALLLLYLAATFYIEEKKSFNLPKEWYVASVTANDESCFKVYSISITIDTRQKRTTNEIAFEDNCPLETGFSIYHPNITEYNFKGNETILINKNLTNNQILILLNSSAIEKNKIYTFQIDTKNDFGFYFFYRINVNVPADSQQLVFVFDGKKYLCNTDCIAILEGNIVSNLPILERENFLRVKTIEWKDSRLLIRFNPQNYYFILGQKIIDGIFLGLIATLLYVILFGRLTKNFKSKNNDEKVVTSTNNLSNLKVDEIQRVVKSNSKTNIMNPLIQILKNQQETTKQQMKLNEQTNFIYRLILYATSISALILAYDFFMKQMSSKLPFISKLSLAIISISVVICLALIVAVFLTIMIPDLVKILFTFKLKINNKRKK